MEPNDWPVPLRANRKHGVFLYFNLANHHPTEDGCVPYQQQVDAGNPEMVYSVNSGWVKTYMGYAAAFARLFSDETSLLAVSANGERDRDTRTGTLDFVNQTYDIYRAEDPNHLVITEFDTFDDPMAVTAFKPKPAGFRTYTCHDRDRPYAELNIRLIQGKYKAEMMRPHPYQAEGNFWGFCQRSFMVSRATHIPITATRASCCSRPRHWPTTAC
ncbi:MAG: hypothetical protein MZW92_61820 [Comamonadaceae bacterium]|nr:hypothetical protein [Comamonadaceae bacterium]MCK7499699.1 hypothetical protein [Comamonadaceae bacterium]